jgi:hypothetical protein
VPGRHSCDCLPRQLRHALGEVFGESIDGVELVEHSWYARLHVGARATTRRNRILLRGSIADFAADPDLMLHEYYHVLRQWNRGRMSLHSYLVEWQRRCARRQPLCRGTLRALCGPTAPGPDPCDLQSNTM